MDKAFLHDIYCHQGIIYKICKIYRVTKEEQEDLFQEIVLQLWKSYPKFRGESKLSTWIYRIALNTALTVFRKKKIVLEYQYEISQNLSWHEAHIDSENAERLFTAIRKLDEADRAILTLYLDDHSYKEIAAIAGISENYVAVKMTRIKEKIKKLL